MKQIIKNTIKRILVAVFPIYRKVIETKGTQTPITLRMWFMQKVVGFNRSVYWPVHFTSIVTGAKNIYAGIETCPGYMPGCYIQGIGKIYIGDYTQISANVGLISSNHSPYDTRKHIIEEIRIGKYCWIGMNSTILPNVTLGDFTIVGAGSVVTKSFLDGYCVIGGNPAKVIKMLNKEDVACFQSKHAYNGYIPSSKFREYARRKLDINIDEYNLE
jgi:acetyltransferase-like isoleucine patch superfamily enzyme